MSPTGPPARVGLLTSSASRLNGGVFEAVVKHVEIVRALGHEPVVIALKDEWSEEDRPRFDGAEMILADVTGPASVGYARDLSGRLEAARLDLLHLHGIWMYPSVAAQRWTRSSRRPYVISPHGMLDPWILAHGRGKKALAKAVYERRSWRTATLFHALTETEARDIATIAGPVRIATVPNAVTPIPNRVTAEGGPYVAYLGRIHPKKNLDALVRGWRRAADVVGARGMSLVIAGWGEADHVSELERLLAEDESGSVRFIGPVYGDAKRSLLAGATALALPSHSEGMPMTVLEAWGAGTPVLMSAHCNLPEGFTRGAALDSGTTPESVELALRTMLAWSPGEWLSFSDAGRQLIDDAYAPAAVAAQWEQVYRSLLQRPPGAEASATQRRRTQ